MKAKNNFNTTQLIAGLMGKLLPEDYKKLNKFLASPYHNSNKRLPVLFKEIWKFYPGFNHPKFTRAFIAGKVYGNESFHQGNFQNLCGELTARIKDFLAVEEVMQDAGTKADLLVKGFGRRNNYSQMVKTAETALQDLQKKEHKDSNDFERLLRLNHALYAHPLTDKSSTLGTTYIVACMDALDRFYGFSKMRYSMAIYNKRNVAAFDYRIKLLSDLKDIGRDFNLDGNILFEFYQKGVILLKEKDDKAFVDLKIFYKENCRFIEQYEKGMMLVLLINFSNKQLSLNKQEYLNELVELYKLRDEQNLFVHNNTISDTTFTNVVVTAAKNKDWQWATYFVEKYKSFLSDKVMDNAILLSHAYIYFYKNEFNKATKILLEVQGKSLAYKLRFRSLNIRAFYELSLKDGKSMEFTMNLVRQLKAFLRKRDLNADWVTAYHNFCLICIELIDEKPRVVIREKIKNMELLMFREWLNEKVDQLK